MNRRKAFTATVVTTSLVVLAAAPSPAQAQDPAFNASCEGLLSAGRNLGYQIEPATEATSLSRSCHRSEPTGTQLPASTRPTSPTSRAP